MPTAPADALSREKGHETQRKSTKDLLRGTVDRISGAPFRDYLWHLLDERLPNGELSGLDLLPSLVCQACTKPAGDAGHITASWQLVRLAAKILDDIEDEQCQHAHGPMTNAAVAMLALAQEVLQGDPLLTQAQVGQLTRELQRALLDAAAGQHVDLVRGSEQGPARLNPDDWLQVAYAKTGVLVAWAAKAGAVGAAASGSVAAAYATFGSHLGLLLQLADDFNDVWGHELPNDLTNGHLNLAVSYAQWVGSEAEMALLQDRLRAARSGHYQAVLAARELLNQMGAQAYFVSVAELYRQKAFAALAQAEPCPGHASAALREMIYRTFPDPLKRDTG